MLNLIRNEWMKLWHKKATWIMTIILVIMLIGIAGIMKWATSNMQQAEETHSWEENLAENQAMLKAELSNPNIGKAEKESLEEELALTEYRLDNNRAPLDPNSRESYVVNSHSMLSMVTLFVVIAAASIVATEFSQGTIKMLLSRPVKRWKILTSKYLTSILFALFLIVVAIVSTIIAGYLFYDSSGGSLLEYKAGSVVEISYWGRVLTLYGLQFVGVLIYTTFAFMMGSVFRSSSLAIGLSIFLLFMGPNVVFFLSRFEFTKYILFTHTDLTGYITGNMFIQGISMPFSIAVLAVYVLIFLVISYWSFIRRDVTA
ncbi:ABC transporter permease [Paenisporosarcina indica]|uniref:ABC transporter permease n=1 Tax=Paenisporosarcina indica TaxID=650093 RepID=UPI00094F86ED|nr:ABC transporter permease subunit [Paenisporosarcina indica]